jgi:DNA-binding Lrp family transcriptional regulator
MARALVFISTRADTGDVVRELAKVAGVSEAHSARGLYDAVAMVQADSLSKVKEIVSKNIRSIDNIKNTLTLTLVETPLSAR